LNSNITKREKNRKKIIHFSTDCVFDGKVGDYLEDSFTNALDQYGRTKAFGEIAYEHTLTIRSSFIGLELFNKSELLEWCLAQEGKSIKGFTKAMYSGVSIIYLSEVIVSIINEHPTLSGLRQLSIEKPISKYNLLCIARDAFKLNIEIIPDDSIEIKPTLNGAKFKKELNLKIPTWEEMMLELAR